jgi:murein L,D-transpeptidase YcbB/YkuD
VKNKDPGIILFLLFCFTIPFVARAQTPPEQMLQWLATNKSPRTAAIKQFYEGMLYQPVWMKQDGDLNRAELLEVLRHAPELGLSPGDYNTELLLSFHDGVSPVSTREDSLYMEMKITDVAIHFFTDISYGNVKPAFGYNGLDYIPGCRNIPSLLAESIQERKLALLPGKLSSASPVTTALNKNIRWILRLIADSSYKEMSLISNKVNSHNEPLLRKLYQLGIIDSLDRAYPDNVLKQKLKEAQLRLSLPVDGYLNSSTLLALNTPLKTRLQELTLSLNYYRWLNCLTHQQNVIVVNIPAAYLKVYRDEKVNLEMRMIVGKTSTPTSTLASKVNEVVLYPYWHVPHSIATKELLPLIKRNPGFLESGNYQVLNRAGAIVDPYSVNWRSLSTGYFPYLIRQSTGCDNALGLLKLNFPSPFGIYLHDSPGKLLFKLNKRFFSHGCMRMEKPMELGHLVLKNNAIAIDTLEQKGCLRNQAPVTVHADDHMPVIVWYNPVDVDSTGRVIFYEDVYKKFAWRKDNK